MENRPTLQGWVARDKSGELWIFFKDEPTKGEGLWYSEGWKYLKIDDDTFPNVTWDFNAATNIKNGVLVTVLRESLLKQLDNGAFEPKKLKRERVKEVMLSFRRDLQRNAGSENTESGMTTLTIFNSSEPTKRNQKVYTPILADGVDCLWTSIAMGRYGAFSANLCFKSEKLAAYAAMQFRDLYIDFCGCNYNTLNKHKEQ